MYKLIALDLDGTLLDSDHNVSIENKEALQKAHQQGVEIILATGRPSEGMQDIINEVKPYASQNFAISYNGSIVRNLITNEIVHKITLTGRDAKKLALLAQNLGAYIHAFSTKYGLITTQENTYTYIEAKLNNINFQLMDFTQLEDDHDIIKIMLVADPEKLTSVVSQLPAELHNEFTIVRSSSVFLEFLHPQVNKATGVNTIAQILGIESKEVICMGDAQNDHHMIKYAGLGIAMGNATADTKDIADFVTLTNNEHGVAYAINKFILNA